jgi:hypothetical protein
LDPFRLEGEVRRQRSHGRNRREPVVPDRGGGRRSWGIPRVRDDAGDIKYAADQQKVITDWRQFAGIEISDPAQARIDG